MTVVNTSTPLPSWAFTVRPHNNDTTEASAHRAAVAIAYTNPWLREILHWSLALCTVGIYLLLVYWWPKLGHVIRYTKTTDIFKATRVVVISETGQRSTISCRKVKVSGSELMLALPSCGAGRNKDVNESSPGMNVEAETVVFEYRCLQFLLNIWTNEFEHLSFNIQLYPSEIHTQYSKGLSSPHILSQRRDLYGPSCVDVPIQPLYELIISEIFHPFYVFQMGAIALWLWDEYYQYAGAVIAITLISLCAELFEARRSQLKLQRMAKFVCDVSAVRQRSPTSSYMESQSSTLLVPGDVIEIYRGMTLPCDVLLLKGSVIVNESMLTGESVPIIKNALLNVGKDDGVGRFDTHKDSTHILFGGTEILGVRKSNDRPSAATPTSPNALALVIRTGFCTTQGQMMRSILHPNSHRRSDFKHESYKFLAVLAGLAFFGCFLSLAMTLNQGLQPNVVIIRTLDTITNGIPPSLPMTMTVSSSIAVMKLRRLWRIMCIAPSRVNYAGQVNTFVFDKTGTLTEEGLDLEGVLVSKPATSQGSFVCTLSANSPIVNPDIPMMLSSLKTQPHEVSSSILAAMATCHSVALIDDDLTGEPMETQLLSFTGWKLVEQPLSPPQPTMDAQVGDVTTSLDKHLPCLAEVLHLPRQRQTVQSGTSRNLSSMRDATRNSSMMTGIESEFAVGEPSKCLGVLRIVRRFDFVPSLQRMSVLVWDRKALQLNCYCKGSPEQIRRLCVQSSVPTDLNESLRRYTETGMRVLAIASKRIPLDDQWEAASESAQEVRRRLDTYSRTEVESGLVFNGLIIFANSLKPDSRSAVSQLMNSGCRCIMATGDNALTATSVARDAAFIPTTSTSIVVGDVQVSTESRMMPKIIWTPVIYSPTLASLGGSTHVSDDESVKNSSSLKKLSTKQQIMGRLMCGSKGKVCDENKNDESRSPNGMTASGTPTTTTTGSGRESFGSDGSSGDQDTEMIVTMGQQDLHDYEEVDGKPIEDIREYLAGKDPRDVVIALTGPAFRLLKECHELMQYNWTDRLLGEFQHKKGRESRCVQFASKKKEANTWQAEIAKEMGEKKDGIAMQTVKEVGQLDEVKIEFIDGMRDQMTLSIAMNKRSSGRQFDRRTQPYEDSPKSKKKVVKHVIGIAEHEFDPKNQLKGKDEVLVGIDVVPRSFIQGNSGDVEHFEMSLFEYCLRFCKIFARMAPDDKASLVASLQSLPHEPLIGMCGDGANDCAALKCADVGLSLSEKEASIAAPFTSTNKTVQSVVDVLREGRGALTNSFQSFKFITLYALVQLSTVSVLYYYGGNLSDPQYLWIDLIVALPLAMTMAWTNASATLSSRMPPRRLVGLPVILSVIGQILIQLIFLAFGVTLLSSMSFYERYVPDTEADRFDSDDLTGYENTVIFLMSNFQYITINLTFCMGKPWRKHSFTNWAHTSIFVILVILSAMFLIVPYESFDVLSEWLSIMETPFHFRLLLASIIALNSIATVCFERFVIISWAVRKAEVADRPSHIIDMTLPLDPKRRVRFEKIPHQGIAVDRST